jgi:hypothetical protein
MFILLRGWKVGVLSKRAEDRFASEEVGGMERSFLKVGGMGVPQGGWNMDVSSKKMVLSIKGWIICVPL